MAVPTITIGNGGSRLRLPKLNRKWVLAAAAIVVALAAAASGLWWWQQQREYERQARPEAVAQTIADTQNQLVEGDFGDAHETINRALDNPSLSEQDKFNFYIQQGAVYESQQKYEEAMESYRNAEAIQESLGAVYSIASLAQTMGDNELAAEYYRKAIPLIPDDDPMKDQRKRDFENWISILEGGEPIHE